MATLVGFRSPLLAHRLCQTAARCVLSQVTREMSSKHNVVVKSMYPDLLGLSKRLFLLNSCSQKQLHSFPRTCAKVLNYHQSVLIPIAKHNGRVLCVRYISSPGGGKPVDHKSVVLYVASLIIVMVGVAYAGVPLYKLFCQQFGLGGSAEYSRSHDPTKVLTMEKIEDRIITVNFSAEKAATLNWDFKPQQTSIKVAPGETALAFYTAKNPTDKPVIGISTYTILPYAAAPYFNKIQCFCFEEQILNPHEQVDMPVFFFIDPEFDEDPALEYVDKITLSYTFFEAKEGLKLPLPGFLSNAAST